MKKELQVGRYYSTKELQAFMGIKESTWSHKRDALLRNLSIYYDYEVEYDGRKAEYHILKKLGDYQGIPRKRNAAKRDAVYSSQIIEVIKEDNVQTAANVARIINDHKEIQEFNHKFGTVQEYTRLRMREMFGKQQNEGGTTGRILEKVWVRLDAEHNVYFPMDDNQIEAFYACFKRERALSTQIELEAVNDAGSRQ